MPLRQRCQMAANMRAPRSLRHLSGACPLLDFLGMKGVEFERGGGGGGEVIHYEELASMMTWTMTAPTTTRGVYYASLIIIIYNIFIEYKFGIV